ncbi:MAG: hypothetical protein H0U53_07500 [Actinobacteria bacterium]|nr:hypothetical protein [Actinomycetota bacterium]
MRLRGSKSHALVLCLSSILLSGLPPTTARAQGVGGDVKLTLVSQPIWYDSDDTLRLQLKIENQTSLSLDGFQIVAGVNSRTQTRSDLHQSFDAVPGFEPSRIPFAFSRKVAAFGSTTVSLDEPIGSFPTLASATEGGVYPASLSLLDAPGTTILSSVSTPFILYPEKPEAPLGIVPVLPLNDIPSRAPDGAFRIAEDGRFPLGDAIAPGGWFEGWIGALEEATTRLPRPDPRPDRRGRRTPPSEPRLPPLKISIAPTGRLIEEIADLRNGYRLDASVVDPDDEVNVSDDAASVIDRLTALLMRRSQIQGLLVPYSFPDLPELVKNLPPDHLQEQLLESRSVVEEALGTELDGDWVFPPAGRLDKASLEDLQLAGYAAATLFSEDSLESFDDPALAGCPEASPSFTCPVSVETIHGTSAGFVGDNDLNAQLALLNGEGGDRQALQRLFAETAQIHAELPGIEDRFVQITLPSLWHPPPELSRLLLRGLRGAPWLRTFTATEALDRATPKAREIVGEARPIQNTPGGSFYDSIDGARQLIDSFATAVSPTSDRLLRLRRNVLVAESRSWWPDSGQGSAYAQGAEQEAVNQLDQISLGGVENLTLTSREGQLQLILVNDGLQPLRVQIRFVTPNLLLADDTIEDQFEPGSTPLNIEAIVRTSGTFPVNVVVETIDGRYRIVEREIVVRSTSLNQIALGLTIGALLFLILFYTTRAIRRRSASRESAEAPLA